jgi:hypothetical protein
MARLLELSGTTEWREPVADFTGILVLNPKEFEQAMAYAATTPTELAGPKPSRRLASRTRGTR